MKYLDLYIYIIFVVKICFILMALSHLYLKSKGKTDSDLDKKIVYWKEQFEFIFILLMAILLIHLFNPRNDKTIIINTEAKLLLYLFGFVLIITANWNDFIHNSLWFTKIQSIIGPTYK
jgi:hypothetical protein